ncbi:unnamed protein product [Discula destructiva]
MATRSPYLVNKSWKQRRGGIMKKADELRTMFNARVAILIEKDGHLFAYMSHPDFPAQLPGPIRPANITTPDHFVTIAQHEAQQRREESSLSQDSDESFSATLAVAAPETPVPRSDRARSSSSATPVRRPMARDYFTFPDNL